MPLYVFGVDQCIFTVSSNIMRVLMMKMNDKFTLSVDLGLLTAIRKKV